MTVRREPGQPDDWLVVNVKDTGIGISPEQQAKLFQRVYARPTRPPPASMAAPAWASRSAARCAA